MKKTGILLTFPKELSGTNDRIFDALILALRSEGIDAEGVQVKEYDDDHGDVTIYQP